MALVLIVYADAAAAIRDGSFQEASRERTRECGSGEIGGIRVRNVMGSPCIITNQTRKLLALISKAEELPAPYHLNATIAQSLKIDILLSRRVKTCAHPAAL